MNKLLWAAVSAGFIACNSPKQTNVSTTDSSNTAMSSSETPSGKWISLFDGKTTNGWHTYGGGPVGKAWVIDDGALHLSAAAKKGFQTAEGGDILTNDEFENYHFKVDWKIAPQGNSGIIFNINEDSTKYKYPWQTGPEMQVLDNGTASAPGHDDAKIVSHRAGDLYDLIVSKEVVKPAGQWNTAEIIANKGKLTFMLNGQETLTTTMWNDNWKQLIAKSKFKDMPGFGTFMKGRIGLQDHGNDVWFKNIMIQKL